MVRLVIIYFVNFAYFEVYNLLPIFLGMSIVISSLSYYNDHPQAFWQVNISLKVSLKTNECNFPVYVKVIVSFVYKLI